MPNTNVSYKEIETLITLLVTLLPKDKESEKAILKTALVSLAGVALVKLVEYLLKKYQSE